MRNHPSTNKTNKGKTAAAKTETSSSHVLKNGETSKQVGLNHGKSKKKSNNNDNADDDSSMSIPLSEWKKQMEMKKKKGINKSKAIKNVLVSTSTTTSNQNSKKKQPTKTTTTTNKTANKAYKNPKSQAATGAAPNSNNQNKKNTPSKTKASTPVKKPRTSGNKTASRAPRLKLPPPPPIPDISRIVMNEKMATCNHEDIKADGDDKEEPACCLCHCGVDYSDRALFFSKDRKHELEEAKNDELAQEYYFRLDDPYLDESLYDRSNALVYCDSCNRLYHQKCHFVPLLILPRGDWNCLICSLQQKQKSKSKISKHAKLASVSNEKNVGGDIPWKRYMNPQVTNIMFKSPPVQVSSTTNRDDNDNVNKKAATTSGNAIQKLEQHWELVTADPKAKLWSLQLKQLKTFLNSQASNIRMAQATLETLTSTKRNRAHFIAQFSSQSNNKHNQKSQELAQTLVRLFQARWKIRQVFQSLEDVRTRSYNASVVPTNIAFQKLIAWCQQYPQHADHVFPFGTEVLNRRRLVPRTREMKLHLQQQQLLQQQQEENAKNPKTGVPTEIAVLSPNSKKSIQILENLSPPPMAPTTQLKRTSLKTNNDDNENDNNNQKDNEDDDNSSGITLDDLQCCICMVGDSTDENDVLLCDGQGCYRAFHMKCIHPPVLPADIENEDENWFCPLCSAIPNFMADLQLLCMSDDWEHRRAAAEEHDDDDECSKNSLKSWNNVDDIFPHAEWEYNTALKLKNGKSNEDTAKLLAKHLGEDFSQSQKMQMPIGSDSEDENDYSLFDEASFEERRRKEREAEMANRSGSENGNDNDDDSSVSTRSSQATLVEMSSVELNIGKDELAALSPVEDDDDDSSRDDDGDSEKEGGVRAKRKSRRLRNISAAQSEQSSFDLGAEFSESNIIEGKRRRKPVDYQRLNDALFGGLTEKEKAQIDDTDDFKLTKKRKRSDEASSSSSSDDESSSSSNEPPQRHKRDKRKESSQYEGSFQSNVNKQSEEESRKSKEDEASNVSDKDDISEDGANGKKSNQHGDSKPKLQSSRSKQPGAKKSEKGAGRKRGGHKKGVSEKIIKPKGKTMSTRQPTNGQSGSKARLDLSSKKKIATKGNRLHLKKTKN